ncbi:MAG: ATP-binding protein [Saprospiraceae bacterium]|nr:ATP-binding protein [Saprospiraceae bacterium]
MKPHIILLVLFFAAAFVGMLILILWQQRKTMQKLRSGIACDLHDDMGASLSNISMLAGLVSLELTNGDNDRVQAYLNRIGEEANQVHSSISDTVVVLGNSCRQLGHLAAMINRHGHELLEHKGIHFSLSVSQALKALRIPPSQRRHLYLIIKEALHNAMRHSDAKEVSVRFGADCRHLYCTIQDDGKGFDSGKTYPGAGIGSMNMRMTGVKGKLKIKSSPGNGCTIQLSMPILPWWHPAWWRWSRPKVKAKEAVTRAKATLQSLPVDI